MSDPVDLDAIWRLHAERLIVALREAQAETAHWKANHAECVRRKREKDARHDELLSMVRKAGEEAASVWRDMNEGVADEHERAEAALAALALSEEQREALSEHLTEALDTLDTFGYHMPAARAFLASIEEAPAHEEAK